MATATIYTTSYCSYCRAAKRLLEQEGVEFEEINLDRNTELRQRLSEENGGWRTVPMVFIDDRFVGGHAELARLRASGRLKSCPSTS